MEYSKEQVKDITEREKKGIEALKALNLTPAAQITKINLGNDTFVDRVQPYLADTLYTEKKDEPVKKDK